MQIYARILLLMTVAVACQQAPKADKAAVTDAQHVAVPEGGRTHQLDTSASMLFWIGTKPTGEHKGSFRFSGGELFTKDSSLIGGHFSINITSIANLDLSSQPDMKKKLEDELRG